MGAAASKGYLSTRLAALGGLSIGLLHILAKESATSGLPSDAPDKPVTLPPLGKGGGLVYIKTGFPPWLMGVGSHIVCNCPLPEINSFCENGWIEIGFNTNTGPWIQPEDDDPNVPVGWPFSLLHASASVDLNGVTNAL